MTGKLILLSNFGDGYIEMLQNAIGKKDVVFSYIPSRTELGKLYFERICKAYQIMGVRKFNYIDIDQNYIQEYDSIILNSDVIFLAGGDDPFIIKNFLKRKYDILLQKYYNNGGLIMGLCAGASILSQYSIVSDYQGMKFEKLQVIPWGLSINDYLYYSRFDETCDLNSLREFSSRYDKTIIAASLNSAILIDNGEVKTKGKVILVERGQVLDLQDKEIGNGTNL